MMKKTNMPMRQIGTFKDKDGRWPAMPIYEMPDETPESWNAKAARINAKAKLESERAG